MELNEKSIWDTIRDRKNNAGGLWVDWSSLHTQGQELYRVKKYEDALRCFSLILKEDRYAPLVVHDNRAATYIKLGNFPAALDDGRKMIQLDESNCIGYLRTGKILQLKGQPEMAVKIYQLGLHKASHKVQDYELLQAMHSKLVKQLAPPKLVDPLHALPLELVEMSIMYLRFKEVVSLLRVSKTWQELLTNMPNLWSNLDFTGASRPVNLGAVRKYIKRSKGEVTRATLDRFGANIEKVPRYITSRCKGLQELKIPAGYVGSSILQAARCTSNLKTLTVSSQCHVTAETAIEILLHCPNMENAEFWSVTSEDHRWQYQYFSKEPTMPQLRSLTLRSGMPWSHHPLHRTRRSLFVNELVRFVPNLCKLSIANWLVGPSGIDRLNLSNMQNLETLEIPCLHGPWAAGPILPSSLQYLDMGKCDPFPADTITWDNAKQLVGLSVASMIDLKIETLRGWLDSNKGNLTYLDASCCFFLPVELAELAEQGYLKRVKELKLNYCDVNDFVAIALSENLPTLTTLYLKYTKITGFGLKQLVTKLQGTLQYVNIDNCMSMGFDAVEWARSMGVRVAFSLCDEPRGRKTIRTGYRTIQFY